MSKQEQVCEKHCLRAPGRRKNLSPKVSHFNALHVVIKPIQVTQLPHGPQEITFIIFLCPFVFHVILGNAQEKR